METSREQVKAAVDSIKESQNSLSVGTLTSSLNTVTSTVDLLKEAWNTTGGDEKQSKLKSLIESDLSSCANIEKTISMVKSSQITYTTENHVEKIM